MLVDYWHYCCWVLWERLLAVEPDVVAAYEAVKVAYEEAPSVDVPSNEDEVVPTIANHLSPKAMRVADHSNLHLL